MRKPIVLPRWVPRLWGRDGSVSKGFTCEVDEHYRSACAGLDFYDEHESKRYCVLHFPGEGKKDDFEKVKESKLAQRDYDFGGTVFPEGTSVFKGFEFEDNAVFHGAKFSGEGTDFSEAQFGGERTDFSEAQFSGEEIDFFDARFSAETTTFRAAQFSGGETVFQGAEFNSRLETDFSEAQFSGEETTFAAARFSAETTNFSEAQFSGERTDFIIAQFSGERTNFSEAQFGAKWTNFQDAQFSAEWTNFSEAQFSGEWTDFIKARFSGESTDFTRAQFGAKWTNFSEAQFSAETTTFSAARFSSELTDFTIVQFSGDTYFTERAQFSGERTDFTAARFSGETTNFSEAQFGAKWTDFSAVRFSSEPTNFTAALFSSERTDFLAATFLNEVVFGEVTFSEKVLFLGTNANSVFDSEAWVWFNNLRMEKPELLTFNTVLLHPAWFINTDVRKVAFTGIKWYGMPGGPEGTLGDEIDALKNRKVESLHAQLAQTLTGIKWYGMPGEPEGTLGDEIDALKNRKVESPHAVLAQTCRRLSANAEENREYPLANEFHYWAMDAVRKGSWDHFKSLTPRSLMKKETWQDIREHFGLITTLYWALSGYGVRAARAFWALFAIWLMFAAVYFLLVESAPFWVFSASNVWQGIDYARQAAVYSLSALVRLNPRPQSAGLSWFQTLVTVEGILGPLQIALLVLALRRQVMR